MGFLQRFMYGRYGGDQLNLFLLLVSVILYVLDLFLRFPLLSALYFVLIALSLFRSLSRNYAKRRAENAKFMVVAGPAIRWVKLRRTIRRDKDHRYFKCPNCGQQLRVPRGKGKITVNCRNCGVSFEEKT